LTSLPRLRRVRFGAVAALCGIALAAGLRFGIPRVAQHIRAHPYFALAVIDIDGNRRLTPSEVLDWAGVSEGTSAWDAAPDLVRLRLQSNPWIRRASVEREFPRRLKITVAERRPAAIVRLSELSYVDRDGHVLGALRDEDSRDFPLITGLEDVPPALMPIRVHRVLRFLRLSERMRRLGAVSEVHVDPRRGLTVFPLHTAVAVVVGWGGWREKLARSARVLAAWEGQVGRLSAVDVSFRDLVVVKLREERHPAAVRVRKRGLRV
jgi:cell division protein FtsQ